MASILLSIRPEYVNKIFLGEKKYEYRKKLPKQTIDKIYIYETSPKKRIVGVAEVKGVLMDSPVNIWENTKSDGGITQKSFMNYFLESNEAFAFILGKVKRYKQDIKLSDLEITQSPQSFIYLNNYQIKRVEEHNRE